MPVRHPQRFLDAEPRSLRLPHAWISLQDLPVRRPAPAPLTGRNLDADLAEVDRLCKKHYGRSCRSVGLDAPTLGRMVAALRTHKEGFTAGALARALGPLMRRPNPRRR